MKTELITDPSSGPGLLNRAAGAFLTTSFVVSIGVFELGGLQLVHYTEHHLQPQPGLLLQDDQNAPKTITVASSAMTAIVDLVVHG